MDITKPYNYPRYFIATTPVVMVINMVSKICAMVIQHVVLMLPIATSEVHVGLMGRRHYKFRIIVNVSYISYNIHSLKLRLIALRYKIYLVCLCQLAFLHSKISKLLSFPSFWRVRDEEVYCRDAPCALN